MPDVSPLCTHRRTFIRNQRLDRALQLPNHLPMPSLIIQNSHTHKTSLMRQRNLQFALTQSDMRCSVRAAFARYALRHFHNPSMGSQRRSIAAASFQLLPFESHGGTKNGRNAIWACYIHSAAAVRFCRPSAAGGKALRQGYQDTVRRHSARRWPDQGLHKIAFDQPVANLRGPRADGGGDRKGVQDRSYESVCRYYARHRRYQSLHKIAYG
jgi:hypothetical protein